MNKIIPILVFLISIMIVPSVFADVDLDLRFNQNNVEILAFDCLNHECSQVGPFSGTFLTGINVQDGVRVSNGRVQIRFPEKLQSNYNYGIYMASEGYLPLAYTSSLHGNGDYSDQVSFYKKDLCSATVENLNIRNGYENQPIIIESDASLDAETASAFVLGEGLQYKPNQWKDKYYSVDTKVTLNIYRDDELVSSGIRYYMESNGDPIYASDKKNLVFEWTPTESGNYEAELISEVIDNQCENTRIGKTTNEFRIEDDYIIDDCYTIIKDLRIEPNNPEIGDSVEVTFDELSNYADSNSNLNPIKTYVEYRVTGPEGNVYSENHLLDENSGVSFSTHSFDFDINQYGAYTISVKGMASSDYCPFSEFNEQTLSFNVESDEIYTLTFDIKDEYGNFMDNVLVSINNEIKYTNTQGLVSFRLSEGSYSYSVTKEGYYGNVGSVTVFDDRVIESTMILLEESKAPQIFGLDNLVLDKGENYTIMLNAHVSDIDHDDNELTWEVWGNEVLEVTLENNVLFIESPNNFENTEQINLRVTDPDGYTDEASFNVYLDGSVYLRIDMLPDISLRANTEFNDAFNLLDYIEYNGEYNLDVTLSTTNLFAGVYLDENFNVDVRPQTNFVGNATITIRVSDNHGRIVTKDFTVYVHEGNSVPQIINLPIATMNPNEEFLIDLTNHEYDLESASNQLSWEIVNYTQGLQVNLIGKELTILSSEEIEGIVNVRLTDADGASSVATLIVNVCQHYIYTCNDNIDNDGDGLLDMEDPGCLNPYDNNEFNEKDEYKVKVSNLRIPSQFELTPGDNLRTSLTFENEGVSLDNVKATVMIPELSLRKSIGPFDLSKGGEVNKNLFLDLPDTIAKGIYYVRMVITSSKGISKRVIHREIEVI